MQANSLLVVFTMWQIATAQQNCPGVKLTTGLGSLLGNIPISNCAPDLPPLPELPTEGLPGLPIGLPSLPSLPCEGLPSLPSEGDPSLPCDGLPSMPSLPSLPGSDLPYLPSLPSLPQTGDCGCPPELPCLPELPPLADFEDYPYFNGPLPYPRKKGCCGCQAKPIRRRPRPRRPCCRCGSGQCKLNSCCCAKETEEDLGVALRIVPQIKKVPIRKKIGSLDSVESLPCEVPSLVSDVLRESLYDGYY